MSHSGTEGELFSLLTVMLAQAINQQDRGAAAQLRETLRCLSLFDQVGPGLVSTGYEVYNSVVCKGRLWKAGQKFEGRVQKEISLHSVPGQE